MDICDTRRGQWHDDAIKTDDNNNSLDNVHSEKRLSGSGVLLLNEHPIYNEIENERRISIYKLRSSSIRGKSWLAEKMSKQASSKSLKISLLFRCKDIFCLLACLLKIIIRV